MGRVGSGFLRLQAGKWAENLNGPVGDCLNEGLGGAIELLVGARGIVS